MPNALVKPAIRVRDLEGLARQRKRKEQTASQEADVSLATELLRAMEKFQSRGDEQGISAPPKKRARVAILCHSPSLTWPLL